MMLNIDLIYGCVNVCLLKVCMPEYARKEFQQCCEFWACWNSSYFLVWFVPHKKKFKCGSHIDIENHIA